MLIKSALILVFFAIMLIVGFLCRKATRDVGGFVLGGRNVGPWLSAFAFGTSYFSAVIFVGYAGQFGWRFGISSTWIGLGNAFIGSLMAWNILGRRTRIMTRALSSATMPEFFGKRYGSVTLKIVASLITFVFLIPYTASLYNGLSRLFGMGFDLDYSVCIIVMAVLTAIYVITGGYMATAVNDFIQGVIMLFGIGLIVKSVLGINGGFSGSLAALAAVEDPQVSGVPGVFASFFGPDPAGLLSVVILTSLGTWGLPQMVQKFYAIKSEEDISKGTVISTVFAIVVAGGCYFLGGFGRLFNVDVASMGYDAIIPEMLARLSPLVFGIALVLVLSASMSTLSSLVLTSASTMTLDFVNPILKGRKGNSRGKGGAKDAFTSGAAGGKEESEANEKRHILVIRLFVAVFIVISAVLAIIQYKRNITFIAQLMGLSWGALAGSFLAPFLYSLYWRGTTKASCYVCFIWGSGIMLLNTFCKDLFPAILKSPINCGAAAMLGGLIVVPLVSFVTKKPDPDFLEDVFSSYEAKVLVPAREALTRDGE